MVVIVVVVIILVSSSFRPYHYHRDSDDVNSKDRCAGCDNDHSHADSNVS